MEDLKYKEMIINIVYNNNFMDYCHEKKKIEEKKIYTKKFALKVIINNRENINNNF